MTNQNHPDHKKHKNLKVGIRLNKTSVDIKNKYFPDAGYTLWINHIIQEWAGFKKNQEDFINNQNNS